MPSPHAKQSFEPSISDEAVAAKTGRGWREWFAELDHAGARDWDHKTIAKSLRGDYGLTGWWSQMVAVTYEQAAGLRARHQMPDGYQIQRQRTVGVSADAAWEAVHDPELRKRWLPEAAGAKVRSMRADRRTLRLDWSEGRVLLGVQPKSADKCAVGAQHSQLPSSAAGEEAKAFWAERLERLVALLEAGELR